MKDNEKGSMTIEFVYLYPIIIATTFFLISCGLWIFAKVVVVDAAREGARHVALGLSGSVQDKVKEVIRDNKLDDANVKSVQVVDNGDYKEVTVTYQYNFLLPGVPMLLGGSSPFESKYDIVETSVFKDES